MARISRIGRGKTSEQSGAGRKLRNLVVVGGLLSLSSVGAVFVANSAVSAPAPGQSVTICHATNSNTNPYVIESPNINSTGLHGGHINHTGPIWDPTLKAQGIKWGDIIPPFTYTEKSGTVVNFPGLNWTTEGQAILANGCNIPAVPTTVTPVSPTVTQSVCNVDHHATDPTITLPTTPGITYTANPPAPYTASTTPLVVTVTATANAGFTLAPPGAGSPWDGSATSQTMTVTLNAEPTCSTVATPVSPTVTQSVCAGSPSAATEPTITLPTTPGITYTANPPAPYTASTTPLVVTVTATANAGFTLAPPGAGSPWDGSATSQTMTVTLNAEPTCSSLAPAGGVTPVSPTVTNSVCAGDPSQATAATLTLATEPAGVTYTASAAAPFTGGEAVTVTAVADATHVFSAPAPAGWTFVNTQKETFALTFGATPVCSGALANTGVKTQQLIELGGVVLLFGLGLQFLAMGMRRRNQF